MRRKKAGIVVDQVGIPLAVYEKDQPGPRTPGNIVLSMIFLGMGM